MKTVKQQFRKIIRQNLSVISPKMASKILFKSAFKRSLNLKQPKTLNEKLMWLKLNPYYKNDLVTQCADKFKVRDYIESTENGHILNDLIGSWNTVEEIEWEKLPSKFVIKCNHGAGYNLICKDKKNFDIKNAKFILNKWMREDYWKKRAETNYKYIPKKIICEKYIETPDGKVPEDYKIYCFNGKPNCVMLCLDRESDNPKFYYFDMNWNYLDYSTDKLTAKELNKLEKPEGFEEMFKYAEILCKPFPFVRADFYLVEGKVIFGELTFTPGAALDNERLEKTDMILGDLLSIK